MKKLDADSIVSDYLKFTKGCLGTPMDAIRVLCLHINAANDKGSNNDECPHCGRTALYISKDPDNERRLICWCKCGWKVSAKNLEYVC